MQEEMEYLEAEYMAIEESSKEATCLRGLYSEL